MESTLSVCSVGKFSIFCNCCLVFLLQIPCSASASLWCIPASFQKNCTTQRPSYSGDGDDPARVPDSVPDPDETQQLSMPSAESTAKAVDSNFWFVSLLWHPSCVPAHAAAPTEQLRSWPWTFPRRRFARRAAPRASYQWEHDPVFRWNLFKVKSFSKVVSLSLSLASTHPKVHRAQR